MQKVNLLKFLVANSSASVMVAFRYGTDELVEWRPVSQFLIAFRKL
jgi:hypothetical protein